MFSTYLKNSAGFSLVKAKVQKIISSVFLFVLFINLIGCASLKPYPVCFSDCSIDKEEKKKIVADLAAYLRLESKEVVIHPTSRWILAKTNFAQHKRLTKVWPRMACIGDITSGKDVTKNAQCVEYLYAFMKNKNYLEFDIDENQVHSDEAPGAPHVICCCEL